MVDLGNRNTVSTYPKPNNLKTTMSIENQAKNIEGKVQAAAGEVTGNSEDKLAGNAKQAQSKVSQGTEDLKDKAEDVVAGIKEKVGDAVADVKAKFNNM